MPNFSDTHHTIPPTSVPGSDSTIATSVKSEERETHSSVIVVKI